MTVSEVQDCTLVVYVVIGSGWESEKYCYDGQTLRFAEAEAPAVLCIG